MALELDSLQRALISLENSIRVMRQKQVLPDVDPIELDVIKAGVVQNFEFSYELCWKFMKRWLEENIGSTQVDGVPRRELFRLAAESRLLNDVERWMDYHRARNRTSHVYDPNIAEIVVREAVAFAPDAKDFLHKLEERNA
jgi:nucleotidyltransferase substrate binding protein (TIGR01987 family)